MVDPLLDGHLAPDNEPAEPINYLAGTEFDEDYEAEQENDNYEGELPA